MSYPAIEAKEVRFSYGKNEILHGVGFAAERGQLIAVLGPNGAGKSTLFRCLLGLYGSYRGSITIDGREVKTLQPREIAAKVAYIPQTHTPTFHYTVLEMVLMGTTHRVRGLQSPGEKELAIARGALAQVGIADMERRSYGRLSGGEQQLVLIARALAQQTELLIMDEPTSSLDYGNQLRVMQRVKGLAQQGYTILLSSHNPQQALLFADRILALHEGVICADGTPEEVFADEPVLNEAMLKGPCSGRLARRLNLHSEILTNEQFLDAFCRIYERGASNEVINKEE